jgi:hypothetical protein
MNGIYYKEGIYLVIDNDTQNDICIFHYNYKSKVSLYGGRISLSRYSNNSGIRLSIDDVAVIKMNSAKWSDGVVRYSIERDLSFQEVVSHLNAIEVQGVDAFIQNYKQSINFLYSELKELNQKTESLLTSEQDDSKLKSLLSELAKIRDLLFLVLPILFSLQTFMIAGLENEKVISVCQSIMDSL